LQQDYNQTQDDLFTRGLELIAAMPLEYASSFSSVLGLTAQQQPGTRRTRAISTVWSKRNDIRFIKQAAVRHNPIMKRTEKSNTHQTASGVSSAKDKENLEGKTYLRFDLWDCLLLQDGI